MNPRTHRGLALWMSLGLLSAAGAAPAGPRVTPTGGASVVEPVARPTLAGPTATGREGSLAALRGQVVLVMVWSSECPVCLNKMPEIRANHAGWVRQGFQVVLVNTDRRPEPLREWEALRQITMPGAQQWLSFWARAPGFATSLPLAPPGEVKPAKPTASSPPEPNHAPLIYVLDRQGVVRFQSAGRMPTEVWDAIAELL